MCYILNIETATTVCSVSISNETQLLAVKELDNGFTHAENLHLFIREILETTALHPEQLNAIAISKGPGSYTGLRIGSSTAKGLAYALNIPLISVDTLQVMAAAAREAHPEANFYCPMIDARRMEVYTAVYDHTLALQSPVEALIVDEASVEKFNAYDGICFFGDGMPKCQPILSNLKQVSFVEGITPSAKYMPALAFEKFNNNALEDVAYFEPFYLKDFLILKKKSKE